MNIVVVQGTLSSEPVERTLRSGLTVMDWNVSVDTDGAKQSVPVQWVEPSKVVQAFDEGDSVVVYGSIRRRFFRARGTLASRTEVVGEAVAKPTQRVATRRLLERAKVDLVT